MNYFTQRINEELGATDKDITLKLNGWDYEKDLYFPIPEAKAFREDKDGNIVIPLYDIERNLLYYDNPDFTGRQGSGRSMRSIEIIRYADPKTYKDEQTGETRTVKYKYPKGAESRPYFPKFILDLYEHRKQCKTLVLTEGYFKSFKACMHEIPCIGLQSISCYREKTSGAMFGDIMKFIDRCGVQNIIMLYDGDCTDISIKALNNHSDLRTRPAGFISSLENIRELFKDSDLDFYFACVNTNAHKDFPKGLDDLLCAEKGNENEVKNDLLQLSKYTHFFTRIACKRNLSKLYNFFNFNNIDDFYSAHAEKIGTQEFVFKNVKYQYNPETQLCEAILKSDINNFCRVGDDYYELVYIPNQYGQIDAELQRRLKSTIIDDYKGNRDVIQRIPKYKSFCNVPNHLQYQKVVNDCYNLYNQFTHKILEGDCTTSLELVKHIFGEKYFEIGLDYIQLLFQKPTEMLPVLCLVSKENKTGKSTFVKWLSEIFGLNTIFVSSQDFEESFNFHWAGKLLVMCEETELEKNSVMDRVKTLSTANKVTMNRKGKDHQQVSFFGKFILCSNNEDRIIKAGKNDERYFVLKIDTIQNLDPFFSEKLNAEIPYFLNFLNNRQLKYPKKLDRMWFPAKDYRTEAFEKVVAANRPRPERELRLFIHDVFTEYNFYTLYNGEPSFLLAPSYITKVFFNAKYDREYIKQILQDIPHETYRNSNGENVVKRFRIPYYSESEYTGEPCIKFALDIGRPCVFFAKDFLTTDEYNNLIQHKETTEL